MTVSAAPTLVLSLVLSLVAALGAPLVTSRAMAAAAASPTATAASTSPSISATAKRSPPGSEASLAVRARAWQESLELERREDLEAARARLIDVWGTRPDNHDVAVRLGWLHLLLEEPERAAYYYRLALFYAPGSADAKAGLASARAQVEAQPALTPSAWGSYVRKSTSRLDWDGFSVSLGLPFHLTKNILVRGAYAHTALVSQTTLPGVIRAGSTWRSHDAFVGVGAHFRRFGAELLGMGLFTSDLDPVLGANLRLWGGGAKVGLVVDAAALELPGGPSRQLQPAVFSVLRPWLVLRAGPRLTWDEQGFASSMGAQLVLGTVHRLFLDMHYGTERWRVDATLPAVAAFRDATPWGGSGALVFALGGQAEVGVHAGFNWLRNPLYYGYSGVVSVGFRWIFNRRLEK